jgi:hypothetical protein
MGGCILRRIAERRVAGNAKTDEDLNLLRLTKRTTAVAVEAMIAHSVEKIGDFVLVDC